MNVEISKRRVAIGALGIVGVADSLYMLAYHVGLIDSLVCPFFGEGCNIVGRSKHARHFGVPNALSGVVGYSLIAALALRPNRHPERRRLQSLALAGMGTSAAAVGAYLAWEQKSKVRAWCFWCLLSAAISLAITPLAISELRQTLRGHRPTTQRLTGGA